MNNLIARYEQLRKLAHELDVQANWVDEQLIEIEHQLPDDYRYPGDPSEEEFERSLSEGNPPDRLPWW